MNNSTTNQQVLLRILDYLSDLLEQAKTTHNFMDPHYGLTAIQNIRSLIEKYGDGGPRIICLCGSTRFTEQMLIKQWELTKQGYVVLSWCALPDSYFNGEDKTHVGDREGVKKIVDDVHKRKIDLADEILVINSGGYVGESTTSEIRYAHARGKIIGWLEPLSRDEMLRILGVQVEE